jgi:hypothetical protein
MKKLLCLLLIGGAFVAFTSCSKNCTCKEKVSGVSIEYPKAELEGHTCKEMQDALNYFSESEGENQNWSCK